MLKKKEDNSKLSLASILVMQGSFRFYIASMPSDVLRDTCFTITREDDPVKGFQRRLDESRAKSIADYIDEGTGSIPTAIILSAQEEAQLVYNSRSKTINLEKHKRAFLIIDGQHRVWGFIKAKSSIRVPVVIYEGLTRIEEAKLFIDINQNQKQVPEGLLLDVKTLLNNESEEEKRCSQLFEKFYMEKTSILKEHLVRTERISGKVSRITFNNSVSNVLKYTLKDLSVEKSFDIINNYLRAIQNVFDSIDSRLANAVTRPIFFQALLEPTLFAHILDKTNFKHEKLTIEAFTDIVNVIKDNLSKQKLIKPGKSYKKLAELFLESISRGVYIKPNIITEE